MKRFILPSLCVVLLAGCGAVDGQSIGGSKTEITNAIAPTVTVRPPTPPPELPVPVQEVVRLAQTTLGESVLVDYIATIQEPYRLDADQVIYLNDLGVPSVAIQALLKHEKRSPAEGAAPLAVAAATQPPLATPARPPEAQPLLPTAAAPLPPAAEAAVTQVTVVQPVTQVSYNTFYDTLSPYGVWVELPDFGRCWRPTVAVINPGWRPYCDEGYWVWSDCGWFWRSHYSWGWAPFHYGRWHLAPGQGWCWIPDNHWGPAWVTWRSSADHCGWAPLPPSCGWSVGLGLTWSGRRAAVDCDFGLGFDSFVYLGWNRFCDPRPWRYCASRSEVIGLHHGARPVNDIHTQGQGNVSIVGNNNTVIVNNGPGLARAQQHARGEIPKVRIVDSPDVAHTVPGRAPGRPEARSAIVMPVYRPNLAAVAPSARPGPAAPVPRRLEPITAPVTRSGAGGPVGRVAGSVSPAWTDAPVIHSSTPTGSALPAVRNNFASSPARPAPAVEVDGRKEPAAGPTLIGHSGGRPNSSPARPSPAPASVPSRPAAYPDASSTRLAPAGAAGYTVDPSAVPTQITRIEAPKPVSPERFSARNPGQNFPAAPVPERVAAPVMIRPAPSYAAPAASAYREERARPEPVFRSEPNRSFAAPPVPTYNTPARPSPAPGYYPAPSNSGGNGNNGNNGNANGGSSGNGRPAGNGRPHSQ